MVSSMKSNFNQHGRTVTSVEFSLKWLQQMNVL
jgi:hypothetical protein